MAEPLKLPPKPVGADEIALRRWCVEYVVLSLQGKYVEDSVFTARCDAVLQWVKKT